MLVSNSLRFGQMRLALIAICTLGTLGCAYSQVEKPKTYLQRMDDIVLLTANTSYPERTNYCGLAAIVKSPSENLESPWPPEGYTPKYVRNMVANTQSLEWRSSDYWRKGIISCDSRQSVRSKTLIRCRQSIGRAEECIYLGSAGPETAGKNLWYPETAGLDNYERRLSRAAKSQVANKQKRYRQSLVAECSRLGVSGSSPRLDNCVIKMHQTRQMLAAAEKENQRQQEELRIARAAAEEARKDRELDALIGMYNVLYGGGGGASSSQGNLGASTLRSCRYNVGGQVATQTVSRATVCPVSLNFNGITGYLIP